LKLLLDTHAFLFAISNPDTLSPSVSTLQSQRWIGAVSLWEIAVKIQIGKLDLPDEATHGFELLCLPLLHKDPFDSLLIA
jgi:PIN domain nuclease of toxin-antitoxin system